MELARAALEDVVSAAGGSAHCRLCGATLQSTFVDLGLSPLANAYPSADDLVSGEVFYPLCVYVCDECLLVQLPVAATPAEIFTDYAYFSSVSSSWVEHAQRYVEQVSERFGLGEQSQVIEVASNDGYLLQFFVERDIPAIGVEPAANVAAAAVGRGIPTVVDFFGAEVGARLVAEGRAADLALGNNVLAHVPDVHDFVEGLRCVLKPGGAITMEFPHLLRLMLERQFDTIYHEHYSYFSLLAAERLFEAHGLTLFDVEELSTHGGSLRIYAQHANGSEPTERLLALREVEREHGLHEIDGYRGFEESVRATKRDLVSFLIEARREGRSIAAYGAAAKGNTLLNYCGIRGDLVDYVVDRSVHKQGRYLPGTRLPIHAPEHVFETKPDYLLLLPWNLRDEIMEQMRRVREWGCRFVVPIPTVSVLD